MTEIKEAVRRKYGQAALRAGSCCGTPAFTCSFLARCRLRQRISAAKLDGDAGAIGLDCTSPAWGHLTFCF